MDKPSTSALFIDIIDNDKGGHKDLLFEIPGLVSLQEFDLYYFALAIEPYESKADIILAVVHLLSYWRQKIEETGQGEKIYLPIDFSDEYTGCLQVEKKDEALHLIYGYTTEIQGWYISPLDPGDCYKSVTAFQPDTTEPLVVDEQEFITSVVQQIQKLTSRAVH